MSIGQKKDFENLREEAKGKDKTDIQEWRGIIKDNFPELAFPAEIGLSVIGQLLIDDIKNPFALVYVDVPSSGKTIILNLFAACKNIAVTTDDFTPASFVSHAANRKKETLEKNDLLPKIKDKALIIRDLAPIFAKRDEDVQAMLGILIRVLDGEGLETTSGVHGKRGYRGDYLFMLLAASTHIRPRIWKAMGNLGSRLFFLNVGCKEKDESSLVNQLAIPCRTKEIKVRNATNSFIKTLWNKCSNKVEWNISKDSDEIKKIVARFAKILAGLRSSINVWEDDFHDKKYNYAQPIKEMPDRLTQLLYNLVRGHALICNRTNINEEDLKVVARVALDSAPPNRSKTFKALLKTDGILETNKVMEVLKCSRPTALKEMQILEILGIVKSEGDIEDNSERIGRPEASIRLKKKYQWFISNEAKQLIIPHSVRNTL